MSFHVIDNKVLARYEPLDKNIYLLVNNRLRILKKGSYSHNKLSNSFKIGNWEEKYFSIPKNVQIQITKACNFRCTFCYANAINSGKPEFYMAKEKLLSIVDKLYSCGVFNIQYVGGETFMHKDFPSIVQYAKDIGLSQTLITNGIVPGLKIDKYNETVSAFSKIQISVNAIGVRFDEIVGIKIYDRLLTALENICKYNDNVWLSFVVTPTSVNDISEVMRLAQDSACTGVRVGILAKQGRGSEGDFEYFRCLNTAQNELKNAQLKYPSVKVECHFNPLLTTPMVLNRHYSEGISMLFINLDGNIYPFPLLELDEMKLGNIFTDDILDVWRSNKILDKFRNDSAMNEICQSCPTPCTLRSPSMSYLWTGKIGGKIPCHRFNFEG